MPWPPRQPSRDEIAEDEVHFWDRVVDRARPVSPDAETNAGIYGRLLLSPAIAAHMAEIASAARLRADRSTTYTHADREWVDQVISVEMATNILMPRHLPDALSTGVRLDAVEALRAGRDEDLADRERALAVFIRAIHHGEMTADAWNTAEEFLGEVGAVDLAAFTLFLPSVVRAIQMVGMLPEPSDADIDELIASLRDGRTEIPDYRVNQR